MKGNADKALEATEEIVGLGLVVAVDERLPAPVRLHDHDERQAGFRRDNVQASSVGDQGVQFVGFRTTADRSRHDFGGQIGRIRPLQKSFVPSPRSPLCVFQQPGRLVAGPRLGRWPAPGQQARADEPRRLARALFDPPGQQRTDRRSTLARHVNRGDHRAAR
jgi:hypothetical protein